MNKKIFAGVMALILSMSGVLCGCSSEKNTDSDEKSSLSSSKSDSVSTNNEKDKSSAKDASLTDKIYTDYLSQQKLCTISKNFKILEAGTARDNPNGLAGAVKHDFDGDKVDELVTFTFEKNSTNGEDIRIDLLKIDDGKVNVADSKYLTELADLSSQPKENTIYFDWTATTNLITTEYNGSMYFGCLFSEARDDFNRGSDFFGGFGVFTIENDKITEQSVGYTESALDCNVFAKLLPPSIRDTADLEGLVDAENHITLYSGFDSKETGLYTSDNEAISAMLNEFGLDMQYKYTDESSTYSDADPDYHWVSKNGSALKTILCTEYLMSYQSDNSFMNGYDNYYAGIKLVLNSDLETLLNNDNLFTESFTDELALYEDILRYPYYYHEIWDVYHTNKEITEYFVADVTGDGSKELVIMGRDTAMAHRFTIVRADNTVYPVEHFGGFNFLDNGIIRFPNPVSYNITSYFDINTGENWYTDAEDSVETLYSGDDPAKKYTGEEAVDKINKLNTGNVLQPEMNYYDIYTTQWNGLNVVVDINEITYTWQKAYLSAIDEFKVIGNAQYDTEYEYALLYIDDDEIPELYILDKSTGIGGLYTYYNGDTILVSQSGSGRANYFAGYLKNQGIFVTYNNGGMYSWSNEINQLSNGCTSIIKNFTYIDEVYSINDTKVTEKELEDRFAEYSDQFAEITYCSESKIKRTLNGIAETWQNAYIEQINENQFKSDMEYALVYIDNDNIPELVIGDACDHRCGGLYTYVNGDVSELTYLTMRYCIDGYIEKKGVFGICHWWAPSQEEGYDIFQMESGSATQTDAFLQKYTDGKDVYTINEKEVSESEYQSAYEKRSAQFVEITYCTYDEIIEKLNANP